MGRIGSITNYSPTKSTRGTMTLSDTISIFSCQTCRRVRGLEAASFARHQQQTVGQYSSLPTLKNPSHSKCATPTRIHHTSPLRVNTHLNVFICLSHYFDTTCTENRREAQKMTSCRCYRNHSCPRQYIARAGELFFFIHYTASKVKSSFV